MNKNRKKNTHIIFKTVLTTVIVTLLWSCNKNESLPFYGERYINEQGDTVYHQIGDFSLVNQDSQTITPATFKGKIYVADFFFSNCPSICPVTMGQKSRIYERFKNQEGFMMISHTVDPKRDSVAVLKAIAEEIEAVTAKWQFATAEQDYIHNLAIKSYLLPAQEDADPTSGGFSHSDRFVLVDKKGRIRGMYSGTDKARVDQLMKDVEVLLGEK